MSFPSVIGVCGSATSGKDLFCDLVINELRSAKIVKLGFADQLKRDCSKFLIETCGVDDPFQPRNKTQIRPLWNWYGEFMRTETKGQYFIENLESKIDFLCSNGVYDTFLIPDLRYKEYEYDELDFIKRYPNSTTVFIDKFEIKDGNISYSPPANASEAKNNPILRKLCDYHLKWPDCKGNLEKISKFCIPEVDKFLNWINSR